MKLVEIENLKEMERGAVRLFAVGWANHYPQFLQVASNKNAEFRAAVESLLITTNQNSYQLNQLPKGLPVWYKFAYTYWANSSCKLSVQLTISTSLRIVFKFLEIFCLFNSVQFSFKSKCRQNVL